MRDLVVTLIVFGVLPMVLVRPHIGVYLWSWLSYMAPNRLTWGFAYSLPFSAMTAAALLVGTLFYKQPKRIPWTATTVVWVLFVLWTAFTTLFALNPDGAIIGLEKMLKIQFMTFMTLMLINDRQRLHLLVWVIALSIGFYGIKGGVFTILTGGGYRVLGPPGTFIEGNNELALALVMILPLIRYLCLHTARKWLRHALFVAMMLCLLSVVATYSRGGFLALAAMGVFIGLKSRRKILSGFVIAVAACAVFAFMPAQWTERIDSIGNYEQDQSAQGRINSWHFALNLAADHPLVGGGFRTFTPDLFYEYAPNPEDYHDAHSIYFEVLGEHGYVGLGLFFLLGLLAYGTGRKIVVLVGPSQDQAWASDLARMAQVSIIGYAVGGTVNMTAYYDLYYHLIAILLILQKVAADELASQKDVPELGRPDAMTPALAGFRP